MIKREILEELQKEMIAREMMVGMCKWFKRHKEMTKDNFFKVQRKILKKLTKSSHNATKRT